MPSSGSPRSFDRLFRILTTAPVRLNGKIRRGDARTLRGVVQGSIDAIITSPPYMNAIDYLRGHKLALVWLGFTIDQIREIRRQGVGSPAHPRRWATPRLDSIVEASSNARLPSNLERGVRRYVDDIATCVQQSYRVLRSGGYAVYVVSNSMLRGMEIDTAKIIIEVASDTGFVLEDRYSREIPREHRYLPPPQVAADRRLATRMRAESVLRFRKHK